MRKLPSGLLFAVLIFCVPSAFYGDTAKNAENLFVKGASPTATLPAAQTAPAEQSALATPKTPMEFLTRARQLSDLEAAGVPFHLKITFKASGKTEFTGDGTYEEWWESKNVWRKEATLGKYKYIAVHNGRQKAASATSAYIPLRVRQVEGFQIFDISPPPEDKKARWKVSEKKLEGERISIVSRRKRWQHSSFSIKEYGFNQGGLLIDYRDNDLVESFSNFRSFGVVQFPDSMTVALHRSPVLTTHISVLEKLPDPVGNSLFNPKSIPNLGVDPSIFVDIGNDPKHRPKGVTPPKLTHYIDAEYPRSERRSRTEGSLLIKCTVDAKGAVREPYILRSDGAAFDDAAIRAVRQYKFKPATKDGQAGMSTIVVLVAFHIYN